MTEDMPKRPRGRPRKYAPGERTRAPLSVRLRDRIRMELAHAAKANGRSLGEEVEFRLELSLARQQWAEELLTAIAAIAARPLENVATRQY